MSDEFSLSQVHHQFAGIDLIAKRHRAAHPHSLALGGSNLVADALAGDLALELGEGQEHVEREASHAGGRVERLGDRDKAGTSCIEHLNNLCEVGHAAGQPVDLVDEDDIDLAGSHIGEQPHQTGPLHVAAREPAIVIALGHNNPALVALAQGIGSAGLILGIEAVELLFQPILGGLAGIDRAALYLLSHGGEDQRRAVPTNGRRSLPGRSR